MAKEKEVNKELEDELLIFKKEVVEQHEKGFFKSVRLAGFFVEGLEFSLFDPFKDVKDGQLLDEDKIVVGEEDDGDRAKYLGLTFFYFSLLC